MTDLNKELLDKYGLLPETIYGEKVTIYAVDVMYGKTKLIHGSINPGVSYDTLQAQENHVCQWYGDGTPTRLEHLRSALKRAPKKHFDTYFNVYPTYFDAPYTSREQADTRAMKNRVGCKKVTFVEGEWDA